MELWFLFFEARCRHIGLYIPDELRHPISAPSAEGRWPGEDPALNKGPTPLPTALPGLLPQGGSSSLGFSPYNRFEFNLIPAVTVVSGPALQHVDLSMASSHQLAGLKMAP